MSTVMSPSTVERSSSPAHAANPNTDHTTKDGTKPESGFTALTDPNFIPTLDSAPQTRYVQSFAVLSSMTAAVALGAWFLGLEIFQTSLQQTIVASVVIASLFYTGIVWIDWWEIVIEYWWLSFPALAAMGIAVVRMDESMKGLEEVD